MSMISYLGRSKTARSLLAAGWLLTAGASAAYAQSPQKWIEESCDSVFNIKGSQTASYFPGLNLEVKSVPGRCYRDDGTVKSIKEHFKKLEEETDHYPSNREYILGLNNPHGLAFPVVKENGGKEYKLSIVSCIQSSPKGDIDCWAHEDMHAVGVLFPGDSEAYRKLGKRFERMGYKVNFHHFDSEEQSCIAGILRVWESGMPVDDAFLKRIKGRKEAYEKLQGYKITQAHFWKDDLSSVLPRAELYKPAVTKK